MNRSTNRALALPCLLVLLTLPACAKKAPKTPAAEPPTAQTPREPPATIPESDVTEQPLPSELQALNAEVARRGLLGDVFFAFDEFALDVTARERLARNATFLKTHPEYTLTIEGHCDERGTSEYNLALGERRASAALDYLASLAVSTSSLRTVSYGEERPQCSTSMESCWSQNRRAHFVITGRTSGS